MFNLTKEEILYELFEDKRNLENIFSKEVKGFALPFDYYSDLIENCVKECGFTYARISEESYSFIPGNDFYKWRATIFHCCNELINFTHKFINSDEELAVFQIVGHSYDLDIENKWDIIENIFDTISKQNDILPMTTIDIIEYLDAMNKVNITEQLIQNNSNRTLWFEINHTIYEIQPYEKIQI